jgi:hypothetical protein
MRMLWLVNPAREMCVAAGSAAVSAVAQLPTHPLPAELTSGRPCAAEFPLETRTGTEMANATDALSTRHNFPGRMENNPSHKRIGTKPRIGVRTPEFVHGT